MIGAFAHVNSNPDFPFSKRLPNDNAVMLMIIKRRDWIRQKLESEACKLFRA